VHRLGRDRRLRLWLGRVVSEHRHGKNEPWFPLPDS
jgi:hypothetical protein